MSNFISGLLYLKENNRVFEENVEEQKLNWQAEELNDKWYFIITSDEQFAQVAQEEIIELSKQLPILYFLDAEDHKWGYKIFHKGLISSTYFVSHGEINLARDVSNNCLDSEEFRVFKIREEVLNRLQNVLLGNEVLENTWEQVELFKQIINIEEINRSASFVVLNDEDLLYD